MLRKLTHSVLNAYGKNMERYESWVVKENGIVIDQWKSDRSKRRNW